MWTRRSGTQAIERGFKLLDLIAEEPQTQKQLVETAGLTRPTVARLLSALEANRMIARDRSGLYRLGTRPLELAARWHSEARWPELMEPYLQRLVGAFRETAYLCIRDGPTSLCVAGLESPRAVRCSLRIGARTALHAGGLNKTLLAFASQSVVDAVSSRPLERFTANTITDKQRLLSELEVIRNDGYGQSEGEMDEGVRSIGAPLRSATGEVVAAIGVAVPSIRLNDAEVPVVATEIIQTAAEASSTLGFPVDTDGADVLGTFEEEL